MRISVQCPCAQMDCATSRRDRYEALSSSGICRRRVRLLGDHCPPENDLHAGGVVGRRPRHARVRDRHPRRILRRRGGAARMERVSAQLGGLRAALFLLLSNLSDQRADTFAPGGAGDVAVGHQVADDDRFMFVHREADSGFVHDGYIGVGEGFVVA